MPSVSILGRTYSTVILPDGKEWLAEDLIAPSLGGRPWGDNPAYADRGLYYSRAERDAMSASLPDGWRVPGFADWSVLRGAAGWTTGGVRLRDPRYLGSSDPLGLNLNFRSHFWANSWIAFRYADPDSPQAQSNTEAMATYHSADGGSQDGDALMWLTSSMLELSGQPAYDTGYALLIRLVRDAAITVTFSAQTAELSLTGHPGQPIEVDLGDDLGWREYTTSIVLPNGHYSVRGRYPGTEYETPISVIHVHDPNMTYIPELGITVTIVSGYYAETKWVELIYDDPEAPLVPEVDIGHGAGWFVYNAPIELAFKRPYLIRFKRVTNDNGDEFVSDPIEVHIVDGFVNIQGAQHPWVHMPDGKRWLAKPVSLPEDGGDSYFGHPEWGPYYIHSSFTGLLPNNWRIPTVQDFRDLGAALGALLDPVTDSYEGGNRLRCEAFWPEDTVGASLDEFGFDARPSGKLAGGTGIYGNQAWLAPTDDPAVVFVVDKARTNIQGGATAQNDPIPFRLVSGNAPEPDVWSASLPETVSGPLMLRAVGVTENGTTAQTPSATVVYAPPPPTPPVVEGMWRGALPTSLEGAEAVRCVAYDAGGALGWSATVEVSIAPPATLPDGTFRATFTPSAPGDYQAVIVTEVPGEEWELPLEFSVSNPPPLETITMSEIDTIVNVVIDVQSDTTSRASFGVPAIFAHFATNKTTVAFSRARTYLGLEDLVADGWEETDDVYLAARAICSQDPRPSKFVVGRRDDADTTWTQTFAAVMTENDEWYGFTIVPVGATPSLRATEILGVAAWTETQKKTFWIESDDSGIANPASTTDLGFLLKQYSRTISMYRDTADLKDFPAIAWFSEGAPYLPGQSTYAYKRLAGVKPSVFSFTTKEAVHAKNVNTYTTVAQSPITQPGKVGQGEWIDVRIGIDWLMTRIKEEIFAQLVSTRKVTYDDPGIVGVASLVQNVLERGAAQGILQAGSIVMIVPKYADIPAADKNARRLTGIKFKAKIQGAVHFTDVYGTVSV